jgi:hypothetical protein
VVYRGQVVAPGFRVWGGCTNPPDGTYTFTRCDINGNVLDWTALGEEINTGLPPDRNCTLDRFNPTVIDGELKAQGIATCDEVIERIGVTLNLTGWYDNNGTRVDVPIPGRRTGHGRRR